MEQLHIGYKGYKWALIHSKIILLWYMSLKKPLSVITQLWSVVSVCMCSAFTCHVMSIRYIWAVIRGEKNERLHTDMIKSDVTSHTNIHRCCNSDASETFRSIKSCINFLSCFHSDCMKCQTTSANGVIQGLETEMIKHSKASLMASKSKFISNLVCVLSSQTHWHTNGEGTKMQCTCWPMQKHSWLTIGHEWVCLSLSCSGW